jgi:hypothetical protein
MATTPNYGWPIPVATDYVKDGLRDLCYRLDLGDDNRRYGCLACLSAATSFFLTSSDGVNSENTVNVTTFAPFLSERTGMIGLHNLSAGSGAAPYSGGAIETGFFATTSFTGFSIFPDSGTISGRVKIYGVQN